MRKDNQYLLRAFIDPLIDVDMVGDQKPTVREFVTNVRKDATEIYDGNLDENCQLVVDDTRYSIAVVFKDSDQCYLLTQKAEGPASSEGFDFPLESNEILPDSSFKVDNLLDEVPIKRMKFLGIARETSGELGAKNDAKKVSMPCYEAEIDGSAIDLVAEICGSQIVKILTAEEILNLSDSQCSSRVMILKKHLLDIKKQQ